MDLIYKRNLAQLVQTLHPKEPSQNYDISYVNYEPKQLVTEDTVNQNIRGQWKRQTKRKSNG